MRPTVEVRDDTNDLQRGGHYYAALIRFGGFAVEVGRFADEDQWRDAQGNRFLLDGTPVVGAIETPRLRQPPRVDGRCGVERRYIGGPRKPLPYVRRLNDLRVRVAAGEVCPRVPAIRIYAGPHAWAGAKRDLARGDDSIPLVVLPPGDDPLSYDWAPVGLWRYTRAQLPALRASPHWRPGHFAPRAGSGYWAVIEDRRAPLDEDTTDQVAALCLAAGCVRVSAIGMHPFDGHYQEGPRRIVWTGPWPGAADGVVRERWVLQDYRLEYVDAEQAA